MRARLEASRKQVQTKTVSARPSVLLWAVDAFDLDQSVVASVLKGIRRLFKGSLPTVQPIYVLTPGAATIPMRWFDDLVPTIMRDARTRMDGLMQSTAMPIAEPIIVVANSADPKTIVSELLQKAEELRAQAIVTSPATKSRLFRLMMGSVSETMLRNASVPVLILPSDSDARSAKRPEMVAPNRASRGRRTRLLELSLREA